MTKLKFFLIMPSIQYNFFYHIARLLILTEFKTITVAERTETTIIMLLIGNELCIKDKV